MTATMPKIRAGRGSTWLACVLAATIAGCTPPPKTEVAGAGATAGPTNGPRFSPTGPDARDFGETDGYPAGDRRTFFSIPYLVGSHSRLDEVFKSRVVRRASTPSALGRAASEPSVTYEFQGQPRSLDDYLARHPATGFLLAKGDTILVERYQYGRNDRHRLTSWSMAKTVTAMLVGIAIAEGRIRSVDDPAATYVPRLANTEYGRTPIRHLLEMSSGVRFVEEYSGRDDVSKLSLDTFIQVGPGGPEAVAQFNERAVPTGTKFAYASAETQVLGLVLRGATGQPVAEYLREKIWEPIGAEADATWIIDNAGQEATYCCLNAVLRDYARLGLLLAHGGNWRGRQVVPAAWVAEATRERADRPHLRPRVATSFFGYGYQTWIFPGDRPMFAFLGVRGQAIYVDPTSRLVLVHTAVRKQSVDPGSRELGALWNGVVRQLGG